ncbi:MAG: hypothetical protein HOI95_22315 [Chromatiales bacterium]|jgi:hypothetical protein|nr:hypothetical protein [Chromatiales bacterium]
MSGDRGAALPTEEPLSVDELTVLLVDLYCELCQVNRRIGIWDMRRHAICKADESEIDVDYLVKTERLGRIGVERRAVVKNEIDRVFALLVKTARAARPT